MDPAGSEPEFLRANNIQSISKAYELHVCFMLIMLVLDFKKKKKKPLGTRRH